MSMKHWHTNKKIGLPIKKYLGNTNTDEGVSRSLCDVVMHDMSIVETDRFLEPAVGTGAFYFGMIDVLINKGFDVDHVISKMVTAIDVDETALIILRNRIKSKHGEDIAARADIRHVDFTTFNFDLEKFALILTNPPYVSDKNIIPAFNLTKEEWKKIVSVSMPYDLPSRADLYALFILKSFSLLAETGTAAFLCSDTWMESDFGRPIRNLITGKDFHLNLIINAQMAPFFRDDTNAVFFSVTKGENKDEDVTIFNMRTPGQILPQHVEAKTVPISRIRTIFEDDDIPNKRNALILFGPEFDEISSWFHDNSQAFIRINEISNISTTSLSIAKLRETLDIHDQADDLIPVFWQKQARVNSPPNYKTHISSAELSVFVDTADVNRAGLIKGLRTRNIYLSTIIDRFPLVFIPSLDTLHISKYISIQPLEITQTDLAMRVQSVYSMLSMEIILKEGTRKTLRKGECGLAKEISANDLKHVLIPRLENSSVSPKTLKYQNKIIYNIEDALKDPDYWETQREITRRMGLTENDLRFAVKKLLFLYSLRMRNERKMQDFEAWYREEHEERLFGK